MTEQKRKRGRPKGTGKYGEQTVQVRIPIRLVEQVNELLNKEIKCLATAPNEKGK